jgi:hypothetical protein
LIENMKNNFDIPQINKNISQRQNIFIEKKYSGDGYAPNRNPSALLTGWLDRCPPGRALDLACGTGPFPFEAGGVTTNFQRAESDPLRGTPDGRGGRPLFLLY